MAEQQPSLLEEVNASLPDAALLPSLAEYDYSIAERIQAVKRGEVPNGHNPNGILSQALSSSATTADMQAFEMEYHWSKAVETFPYRELKEPSVLMEMANDALYEAGKTYDPTVEANFLTHFSGAAQAWLRKCLGTGPASPVLPADSFDNLVITEHLRPLPPLATQQPIDVFQPNDTVLVLSEDKLTPATVKASLAYDTALAPGTPLTPLIRDQLQVEIDLKTEQGFDWQSYLSGFVSRYSGSSPSYDVLRLSLEEPQILNDQPPDFNYRHTGGSPSVELLRLIGAVSHPDYPRVTKSLSPGFVKLAMEEAPYGLVTDINNNYVIPVNAWLQIRKDKLYKNSWLNNGSKESLRRREQLGKAILERTRDETAEVVDACEKPTIRKRTMPKTFYSGDPSKLSRVQLLG